MAAVAALRDAEKVLVAARKLADDLPGLVLRAVVDEEDPAVFRRFSRGDKASQLLKEKRSRDRQNGFLVITGDDDPKNRFAHGSSSFLSFFLYFTTRKAEIQILFGLSAAKAKKHVLFVCGRTCYTLNRTIQRRSKE